MKINLSMKVVISFILLFNCELAFSSSCDITQGNSVISTGVVTVQRDLAVGSAFSSAIFSWGSNEHVGTCTTTENIGPTFFYRITKPSNAMSYNGAAIFDTSLPGVGFVFNYNASYLFDGNGSINGYTNLQILAGMNDKGSGTINGTNHTLDFYGNPGIIFIKTGSMKSGIVSEQIGYGQGTLNNSRPFVGVGGTMPISLSGTINVLACSITTPNLTFPIGDISASKFGTTIGTIPGNAQNTQNLGLNCDAGANINVMLQGTQNPDVSTTSVLALTGQGNADVAKGVGVQLVYNGAPLELNNRIVLKQSEGGQETFPITARYYQTQTSVSTGKANASATLDLTYQ
ncbi:fimbrial protein [Leclercia adecarboxylata]|uniref:fimbrial protein n=1 Tax=Leclercia adecarboxylata TaxID=83655 RepID=UPI000AF47331|nr:fimbrial protein [Leclercia adecarboxylata]